ncbi:MAG: translation initiation factor IF-2 [Planctomycetaceae bacterium]|nr:translation initiation factor IF-2 [Planctomycetaceae bacterium]
MFVLKIRIFALARELGLDSKVLLGLCDEAGVQLRNALATITPEQRDQIVNYIKGRDSGSDGGAAPAEDLAPTREPSTGKMRDIRVLPKAAPRDTAEAAPEGEVEETPAIDPPESEVTEPVAETPAEAVVESSADSDVKPTDTEPAPEQTAAEETDNLPAEEEVSQPAAESQEAPAKPEETKPEPPAAPAAEKPLSPRKPNSPIHKMRKAPVREMRPIGSVKDRDGGPDRPTADKPKERETPGRDRPINRPLVAAPPQYQPPAIKQKPKKSSEKAMKPDISIDKIVDVNSPLANQLAQLKQAKADHDGALQGGGGRRQGARKGSLLKELQRSREEQRQQKKLRRRKGNRPAAELKSSAQIEFPINVRNLSEAIGRPAKSIIGHFFKAGQIITINDELSEEDALEVAMELGVDLEIKRGRDVEAELMASLDTEDHEDDLEWRPPIITILGHVDHGKTTLVDRLRNANVAAGEAGGITQHIAAYQVMNEGQALTFVDTPGHAAFGEMRARGANVTDIIVLVVAADDGVMPQTEECISHAKSAGVPIVVALNKMDLPDVDEQKTLQQLAQHDLLPAEWGGEYEVVRTSGETGMGLDNLVETLQLTAELLEYKANPDRRAVGVCLEAFRDEGRGVIAWLIVQKGTLRVGDSVLCGTSYGRIRAIYDDKGKPIKEAGPSMPVKVAGLDEVPTAGVHFFEMKDIEEARTVAESRQHEGREMALSTGTGKPATLENILSLAREGEGAQDLPLIIKADTPGSLEAIRGELDKFDHPEVQISFVHMAVGGVNESDVYLASASQAIIIAFHVVAEDRAAQLAEREGVEIRRYNIIYEVTEQIRQSLEGLLRPERVEVTTGRAIVLRTFNISRFGTIAGCRMLNGTISRDNRIHVIRDNTVLNDYRIGSLKREKDDAKEVREGMECGIRLEGFNDVKDGDLLEAFRIDEIQRTLD